MRNLLANRSCFRLRCSPQKVDYGRAKLGKIDNVARLRRKTKIAKPPKLLRKTSASLLKSNKEFAGIEVLFLGHAPDTIADRHYAQAPQKTLDEAMFWLGHQFGMN